MCGLVWFVQLVHYPLMDSIGRLGSDAWRDYHAAHARRTGYLVAPVMVLELITALLLLGSLAGSGTAWVWAQALLAAAAWVITFTVQVPQHGRLAEGFDPGLLKRLVLGNWVRVVVWSARFVLLLGVMSVQPVR